MPARRRGPAVAARGASPAVDLVLATTRERVRRLVARGWPRGRVTVRTVRDASALDAVLAAGLPDLVVVDTGDRASTWALPAALAQRLAPVAAIVPRSASPEALAALGAAGVVEVVLDGVDDAVVRPLLAPHLGTARFTARCDALLDPHAVGETAGALWRTAVSHRGRLVRVATAARLLGVSREHLARTLVAAGAPGPKTLLELVRLLAVQGVLARGASVAAAAAALGYATPSHLARAAKRVVGSTPRGWTGRTGAELVAAALAITRAADGSDAPEEGEPAEGEPAAAGPEAVEPAAEDGAGPGGPG